jgi:four helix bundle protein
LVAASATKLQGEYERFRGAEGCGRETERELDRFLSIAAGSASELDYQLLLARDLDYLPTDAHLALTAQVSEVGRMLYRFLQSLEADG